MKTIIRGALLALLFIPIFSISAFSQDLMMLDELEMLLEASPRHEVPAHFDTVLRGTKIEKKLINIRSIMDSGGQKIILFTTSIKIAGGMSGSPVYVNGKLVGALAYRVSSFNFSNWNWGGISPIEKMVNEANSVSEPASALSSTSSFVSGGMNFEHIPLSIFSQSTTGISTQYNPVELKAGMPILVDTMEWEDEKGEKVISSAMGTITYIDKEGLVYAFGHPFFDAKKVRFSFRTGEVVGTNFSELNSNKFAGHASAVLGTISFDSIYGIYGRESLEGLDELHNFNLEIQDKGTKINSFKIKVGNANITPNLVGSTIDAIARMNGLAVSAESGVTEMKATFNIIGHNPIVWEEVFSSARFTVGRSVTAVSSYQMAADKLLRGIYAPLFRSNYNFKMSTVDIVVNTIPGQIRRLQIADYDFPNKVVWGEDPILELTLVSVDNSVTMISRTLVNINWADVELPTYSRGTMDTDKVSEKITNGFLYIYGADGVIEAQFLDSERRAYSPGYFLSADDFLSNISDKLKITSQRIFAKLYLEPMSGLFDKPSASTNGQSNVSTQKNEWSVLPGGLANRPDTTMNQDFIIAYIDLPPVPSGYVVGTRLIRNGFEVVLQ